MKKIGFDSDKYLKLQEQEVLKRIKKYDQKLYFEIGGKLFDDLHASRVLPGFKSDVKIQFLKKLKDKVEIICCISAKDIERKKVRSDMGLTYDREGLRLIHSFRSLGLYVSSVVITMFEGEQSALRFAKELEADGEKVYFHTYTKGYPNDVETIVSDEGYGANPYVETTRPLVVVTAPGPCSGKLATCLSQLYHEYKRGVKAGYSKFETFPVWNLPLKHPVNIAYEAATADLKDVNMIDMFHLEAYGKVAVNYNRDLEVFPVLKNILKKITGSSVYNSPTDMGVNMAGYAIIDDAVVSEASKQEIVRRYYRAKLDYAKGIGEKDTIDRIKILMSELAISINYRKCAKEAKIKSLQKDRPVVALELDDGHIVYGTTEHTLSKVSSMILNALKHLAKIKDDIKLLSPEVLQPMLKLKKDFLHEETAVLSASDVLAALSICAVDNENARLAFEQIPNLAELDAHATFLVSSNEEYVLRKLGIYLTQEIQED